MKRIITTREYGLTLSVFILLFILQSVVFANEPFRFALFTDLHIAVANQQASDDLRHAVDEVNSTNDIDFVVVNGDVSNLGDTVSLKQAREILSKLKVPFYVLPGNHDIRWNSPDATNFSYIFGDDKFAFNHKGYRFVGFPTAPLVQSGNAVIRRQDIDWMKKSLPKTKVPVFVFTHYPLQTGDVDNWKDMTGLLKKYNVQAVVNGHYHRNVLLNYDGIPGIVCRSNLRSQHDAGGYTLFSVSDSIRVYQKQTGRPGEMWLALPLNILRLKNN